MTRSLLSSAPEPPNILVVDDNFSNILVIEGMLEKLPVSIDRAFSGQEAIDKIALKEYALLLLDVQMPGMDGFQTAEIIRKDERNILLPIIFISAIYNHNYYYQKGLDSGAVDFITKPLVPKVFTSKVNVFLELYLHRKSLEREIRQRQEAEERRARISSFMNRIASGIIKAESSQIDEYIHDLFTWVGSNYHLGFIASYHYNPGDHSVKCLHQWCHQSINKALISENEALELFFFEQARSLSRQEQRTIRTGIPETAGMPMDSFREMVFYPLFENNTKSGFMVMATLDDSLILDDNDLQQFELLSEMVAHSYARKEMENQIRKALDAAQKSDRLKSAFLANLSHEIRTPMNAIMGFSGLLSADNLGSEEKQKYLHYIKQNAGSLLQLINDILELSRIETGQSEIKVQPVLLGDLSNQIITDAHGLQANMNKNNLNLIPSFPDQSTDIRLMADENRIRQVFGYLLSNAFKFTAKGRVEFGVSDVSDEQVCFFVSDTGIGVDTRNQEKIFEIFRQENESDTRSFGGSGLGLSLARSFVNLMGGKIWVESEKEKGSAFYFTVPRAGTHHDESPKDKGSTVHFHSTILIAEDCEANFDLISAYLVQTGVKTIWVKNGREAVNLLRWNNEIDLVLMDLKMPVMNGIDATREIRQFNADLPIIALTAFFTHQEPEEAQLAGCTDFLPKPVNQAKLIEIMAKYLPVNAPV